MPVSPYRRAQEGGLNQPEGSARGGKRKRKRKSKAKPTSKARSKRQRTADRYAHAREDAQLEGLIPTTPAEALEPEQVPSSAQSEQPIPQLTGQAIRHGWAVPEERKPDLVDELVAIIDDPEAPQKAKIAAFNALRMADEAQYERDHPEEVRRAKSGGVGASGNGGIGTVIGSINVHNNLEAAALIREMIQRGELGVIEEVQSPDVAGTPGNGGQQREVEAGTAPAGDQQRTSEGVADT